MTRRTLFAVAACLLFAWVAPGARADSDKHSDKRVVKVMTRNMDAGTDLGWFFVIPDVMTATTITFSEVLASNIPGRAELLADEIRSEQPDLIALEEVTLWESGPPGGPPTIVLDQLQLLLKALTERGLNYAPVVVQSLTSTAAPASPTTIVRFTDRNVILARNDLKHSEMKRSDIDLSNVQQRIYQAKFAFPIGGTTVPVLAGWTSVDVKVRGKMFRFVDTHLQSTITGVPAATAVQVAQAEELIATMNSTKLPVVLAGDFNSNAEVGPDDTATTTDILAAGYTDAWRVFNPPGTGFTWPLFLEDFQSGTSVVPFERIDLIFARDLKVASVQRSGLLPPWPSDHVGVVATLQLESENK
jgi:endonuclease/exonuclease/phosphatase family metal-dependent hydrolase